MDQLVQAADFHLIAAPTRRLRTKRAEIGMVRLKSFDRQNFGSPTPAPQGDFVVVAAVPTRRQGRPVEHSFRLALAGGFSVRGLCGFGWVASLGSKSCHDRTMLEDHSLIRQYDCTEVWSCKRDWRVVHR